MLYSYNPNALTITWNGVDLSHGWAENTFLEIEPLEARKTTTFGADGQMCVSVSANHGAKISLTLQQTSTANQDIALVNTAESALSLASDSLAISAFTVSGDSHLGSFIAWNAVLTEQPTNTFANTVGEKTWVWVCETMIETDDTASILASASNFINSETSLLNSL